MRRLDLVSDCASCAALCCVATSFERSADFAFDKPAGVSCRHLTANFRCAVHAERERLGCGGCVAYECHGAGQRATERFGGMSGEARQRAFLVLRVVHELLWLLTEAAKLCPLSHGALRSSIEAEVRQLDALSMSDVESLFAADNEAIEQRCRGLLRRVGDAIGGRERSLTEPRQKPGAARKTPK